jgi:N-acetylglucosaminyldiphosphoundecaprenol N-acetyl-beta-D-mannosaminyltransferase
VVPGPSRISLLGLPIDAVTHCDLVERVFGDLDSGNGGYIMTANLDNLRGITRDDTLRSLALTADVRVADGMPLLWASRLRGTPLPDRVAGSDLILTLSEAAAQRRRSVFLLGGSPGTADRAGEALCKMFAGLEIAGTCCPDLRSPEPAEELERIRAVLEQAGPDIVFIGLPFPKASVLVGVLREHISATWFLGLGISFSFICGDIHRASPSDARAEEAFQALHHRRDAVHRHLALVSARGSPVGCRTTVRVCSALLELATR